MKEEYKAIVVCDNCGKANIFYIKKGITLNDFLFPEGLNGYSIDCKHCGCEIKE